MNPMPTIHAHIFFKACVVGTIILLVFPHGVFSETSQELQQELKKIEAQINQYEQEIAKTKTQKKTLANKISQLKKEQQKISLQIKAINLEISELAKQLFGIEHSIKKTSEKLIYTKEQMGGIIRAIDEQGKKSLFETMLKTKGFSALVFQLESLQKLSQRLGEKMDEIKTIKIALEHQHADIEIKQNDKKNLASIQMLQNKNLQTKTSEQAILLKETQGKESRYQAILLDSQKRAKEIKNRIYELLGVGTQITFGEAASVAKWASAQTGVRPAFLLAVLTQESDLGKNVGTCNRPGDPQTKSWKTVMKPNRDQDPFLVITQELGMDPNITPISCPMKDANGKQMGWGGAMGPAQFIPSTWILYKNRIAAISGKTPNPWDIRDAFLAAALLLKDNGAGGQTTNSEWRAAMLYFSGSTNVKFRFYGDSVVATANRYEDDIRALT